MLVVYARQCAQCKQAKEMRVLEDFASQQGLKVLVKRTLINKQFREEAERLTDVPQPFVYNDETHTAVHLSGVTENDLQHLL